MNDDDENDTAKRNDEPGDWNPPDSERLLSKAAFDQAMDRERWRLTGKRPKRERMRIKR